jgi:hypothetical protein
MCLAPEGCRFTWLGQGGEQVKARQRVPAPAVPEETDWAGTVARAAAEDVRELLRAERRRRRGRWLAGGLVVLAVGAMTTLLVRSTLFAPVPGDASREDAAPPTGSDPAVLIDLARPFASTPAASWPDGAEGIVPPRPEAVGGFSAEQVAEATRLVRDVLVASRIDHRLIVHHDPTGYLDLLAPDARAQLAPSFSAGREPEVQSLVSLIAPGSTLLPVEPKVSGSMSVRVGESGDLVVRTNYVFAYAFEPPSRTRLVDAMNTIVVVRADVDYELLAGDRWRESSRGLWFGDASGFGYSIGCEAYRKGFLAPVTSERTVTKQQDGVNPDTYFDPTAALPPPGGCRH